MILPPRQDSQTPEGYIYAAGRMYPRYPRGVWSTGQPLLSALGSYWSRMFDDRGKLLKLYQAESLAEAQNYLTFLETAALLSRKDTPVFHRRIWYAVTVRESVLQANSASSLVYGGAAIYDGTYSYGHRYLPRFQRLPRGALRRLALILNRPTAPSLLWIHGQDFHFDGDQLRFRADPFADGRFPIKNILDAAGATVDRELVLWCFSAEEDWHYLYEHYGYILREKLESSEGYKRLINVLLDGVVGGSTRRDIETAFAVAAGIPVVRETRETVETVLHHPTKTIVITDRHAYIHPARSAARVAAGDVVFAGQTLVDTVMVFDVTGLPDGIDLLRAVQRDEYGQPRRRFAIAP